MQLGRIWKGQKELFQFILVRLKECEKWKVEVLKVQLRLRPEKNNIKEKQLNVIEPSDINMASLTIESPVRHKSSAATPGSGGPLIHVNSHIQSRLTDDELDEDELKLTSWNNEPHLSNKLTDTASLNKGLVLENDLEERVAVLSDQRAQHISKEP
eukprot:UN27677